MDASLYEASTVQSFMAESPSCWGDSTPGFRGLLAGRLSAMAGVPACFCEDAGERASTGRTASLGINLRALEPRDDRVCRRLSSVDFF
jgi:hypothetical protein